MSNKLIEQDKTKVLGHRVQKNDRILYFDILRIIATFGVTMIHVACQNWYAAKVGAMNWQVASFWDSMMRWTVPVFVMISGALFLDPKRKITTEKLYKKNIFRIATVFCFWSVIYVIATEILEDKPPSMIVSLLSGHYHMWFLVMIVGLYILVPILRKIVEDRKLLKYFLIVGAVMTFIIPTCLALLSFIAVHFAGEKVVLINTGLNKLYGNLEFFRSGCYIFYFVLGYYLNQVKLSSRQRYVIYALSCIGFIATFALTSVLSSVTDSKIVTFFDNSMINVGLESIGVFVLVKNIRWRFSGRMKEIVVKTSEYSFGVFMVHVLVIDALKKFLGIDVVGQIGIVTIPLLTAGVFVISLIVSMIMHHIPLARRYFV